MVALRKNKLFTLSQIRRGFYAVPYKRRIVIMCGLIVIIVTPAFCLSMLSRALPGQKMAQQSVMGQTYNELIKTADAQAATIAIEFTDGQKQAKPQPSQIGLSFQSSQTAEHILGGSWISRVNHDTSLVYSLDQTKLRAYLLSTFSSDKIIAPTNPSISYDAATAAFLVTSGKAGQAIDVSKMSKEIEQHILTPGPSTIQVAYAAAPPTLSQVAAQQIADQASSRTKLTLSFTYNGKSIYAASPSDIASWISLSPTNTLQYDTATIQDTLSKELGSLMNVDPENQLQSGDTIVRTGRNGVKLTNVTALTEDTVASLQKNQSTTLTVETASIPFTTLTGDLACLSNSAGGKLLLVSISQQHLWACDGTTLASESAVTTGASALTNVYNATPTGTWHIYGKTAGTYLSGSDVNGGWHDYVNYWMPFYGGYGFHDSSWQTFPYGSSLYTTQGSHGCVHLPLSEMAWVYTWAPVGTTVTVRS